MKKIVQFIKATKLALLFQCLWMAAVLSLFTVILNAWPDEEFYIIFPSALIFVILPALLTWNVAEEYFKRRHE